MLGQAFAADSAGTEYDLVVVGMPVQADRSQDLSIESERSTERFDLMADLDRRIGSNGCGTRENRSVVEEHGGCSVLAVGEAIADQGPARVDGADECTVVHTQSLRTRPTRPTGHCGASSPTSPSIDSRMRSAWPV